MPSAKGTLRGDQRGAGDEAAEVRHVIDLAAMVELVLIEFVGYPQGQDEDSRRPEEVEVDQYPVEKADIVAEMICLHMNGYLDENERIESRLLQQGAAYDVIGARFYQLNNDYRHQVLQQYPRQNFNQVMTGLMAQEAARNPRSRTALLRQLGLPLIIRLNPFEE